MRHLAAPENRQPEKTIAGNVAERDAGRWNRDCVIDRWKVKHERTDDSAAAEAGRRGPVDETCAGDDAHAGIAPAVPGGVRDDRTEIHGRLLRHERSMPRVGLLRGG